MNIIYQIAFGFLILLFKLLEIIPTTLGVLFLKLTGRVEEYKENFISLLVQDYMLYEKSEDFKRESQDLERQKLIIYYIIVNKTIPLLLMPKIRNEICQKALKLAYHKLDWKIKMDFVEKL